MTYSANRDSDPGTRALRLAFRQTVIDEHFDLAAFGRRQSVFIHGGVPYGVNRQLPRFERRPHMRDLNTSLIAVDALRITRHTKNGVCDKTGRFSIDRANVVLTNLAILVIETPCWHAFPFVEDQRKVLRGAFAD